jgi:hypothetical protein
MSRRDRNDPQQRKRQRDEDPQQEQEEQAEQAQELERKQEQARDAAQDQLGNQGVAAMLGVASVKPGEAGFALDAIQNREQESEGLQLGGEEPPPDGPLTLDDLVRSWNPTTRRGQDTPDQSLGLYSALPEEDAELLAAVASGQGPPGAEPMPLQPSTALDPLVQPLPEALLEDLGPVVRQALRLSEGTLLHRTWARAASPAAPLLTDPRGRLLHTRARTAALAGLLALDGLAHRGISLAASPLVLFLLDLSARSRCVDEALDQVRASQVRLPLARDVLAALLDGLPSGPVELRPLGPGSAQHLQATLAELLSLPPPASLVPSLVEPDPDPDDPDDDPLGIDRVVEGVLGPKADPLAGIYDAQLQAAEKLAGACARLRVHAAGMLLAVARSASSWSSGAPAQALLGVAQEVDRGVGETLQLLVEIGRAIQRRAVPPPGVRNGLRRVARSLEQLTGQIPGWVVPVVGGVVPQSTDLPPLVPEPADPLAQAWAEGEPSTALAWLLAQGGEALERQAAVTFTRASAGARAGLAPELLGATERAREGGRPMLAAALSVCAGAALLQGEAQQSALRWAERDMEAAAARRNGIWLAAAALVALDLHELQGDPEAAARLRYRAARACWLLGARAALSVLLRWRPPRDDDEDEEPAGWYGYPDENEAAKEDPGSG